MDYLKLFEESIKNRSSITDRNSKILLIDGLNMFIRVWSAVPIIFEGNRHIGSVQGFLKSLGFLLKQDKYSRCIIVFDGKGGSQRRRKLFPEYKNNRKPTSYRPEFSSKEEEQACFSSQLNRTKEYLSQLPVTVVEEDHIEADDSIAYIVKKYNTSDITIVSTDRDFLQLVNDKVSVYSPTKKKQYNADTLVEEFGFHPNNYLLYRVLTGDGSDNIPGVRGLGLKTLLKEFDMSTELTLDEFMTITEEKSSQKKPKKIIGEILTNKDQIYLNQVLMQLNDVDISLTSKNKIRDEVEFNTNTLNEIAFLKMFREDKLDDAIRNVDNWLLNFNILNSWANKQ